MATLKPRLRWIAALTLVGGALLLLRWLDQHPVHLAFLDGPFGPERGGEVLLDEGPGDILLVVDPAAIGRAGAGGRFSTADWSYAWLNLLAQEAGSVRVCTADGLERAMRFPRRVVVLTRSCGNDAAWPPALSDFVEQGGVLVVEQPRGEPAGAAGLEITGEEVVLASVGAGAGPLGEAELDAALGRLREEVRCVSAVPAPGARVLLGTQGRPLVTERGVGAGRVVAVLLDVGRILVANQQGCPTHDDYRMEERHGDYAGIVEPDDLVRDAALRENEIPHVDLFEELLFDLVRPEGLPTIARSPAGSRGIYLLTHDEDFQGGAKCAALLDVSEPLGSRGSFMVIAHDRIGELYHDDRDWFEALAGRGAEIGWHLNRYEPMPVGFWKIEPLRLMYGSEGQLAHLRESARAAGPILSNRNHYLTWHDRYTRVYRLLAAVGIRIDSTCGSNKGRGYLFGTGSPFTPLDTNGLPFPLFEVPFLNQETWGGADLAFFMRLLETNGQRYHGAFVSIFHPHLDFLDPRIEGIGGKELLRRILVKARAEGHAFLTLSELASFERARRSATVQSRWREGELAIEARADGEGLALLVPARPGLTVTLNGAPLDGASLERQEKRGKEYWIVPL
ncbi:MAG: hypothetical protein AB1486_26340 [Planctomycetota bacterium]